jgi:hypothetical protein
LSCLRHHSYMTPLRLSSRVRLHHASIMIRVLPCLLAVTLSAGACGHAPPRVARAAAPARLLSDEERDATVAAAMQLFTLATDAVPVCVELDDAVTRSAPDSKLLAALGPRARARTDCPRTYASMIYNPNAPARPVGYIDPYELVLRWPAPVDGETVILAQLWQGTGFTSYRCTVVHTDTGWKAACRETARGVS